MVNEIDFSVLVKTIKWWTDNHLDKWEKFQYETDKGTIYITISRRDQCPGSFEKIDPNNGRPIKE